VRRLESWPGMDMVMDMAMKSVCMSRGVGSVGMIGGGKSEKERERTRKNEKEREEEEEEEKEKVVCGRAGVGGSKMMIERANNECTDRQRG